MHSQTDNTGAPLLSEETETLERELEERNNAPYDLTIETAVYADKTYTAGIPKTSYPDRVELMLRKWSGVSDTGKI